jgi:hypothetical protein
MKKSKLLLPAVVSVVLLFAGCKAKPVTSADSVSALCHKTVKSVSFLCHDNGKGAGKILSQLKVNVTYLDPYSFTADGYPVFYIGVSFTCKITVTNPSCRKFHNIVVSATHEYYDSGICERTWYPYPLEVTYTKGEPMPGDSTMEWKTSIDPKSQVSFDWTYTPPLATCSGLDQTHVTISVIYADGKFEKIILDSPEAGIFCPPPPINN